MTIECPKCHFENQDDTVYCGKCATSLKPSEEAPIEHTETLQVPTQEKGYEERDGQMVYIINEPVFDTVRSDARFKALLKKMNLE